MTPKLSGVIAGDIVELNDGLVTGFVEKHAGTGKAVTYIGFTLAGADAGNYLLGSGGSAASTATVSSRPITWVTGIQANSKTWDGTTRATLDASSASYDGLIAGDGLVVGSATGRFIDPDVGTHKQVDITGITLGGSDAGNYSLLDSTAIAYADISAAPNPRPSPGPLPSGWADPEAAAARASRKPVLWADLGRIDVTQSEESPGLRRAALGLPWPGLLLLEGGINRPQGQGSLRIRPRPSSGPGEGSPGP